MGPTAQWLRAALGLDNDEARQRIADGRVTCPDCGNRTPWVFVAATGRCAFGHPQRPVVIRGGKT